MPDPARKRQYFFGFLAAVALACGALMAARPAAAQPAFQESPLVIVTASAWHRFVVEIAETPEQRAQGLMFRRSLAPFRGMLFAYGREQPVFMWMKNTFIPLDMLFIRKDGRIARIVEHATPLSEAVIASGGPVSAVLEVKAGTVAALGITVGDLVLHPFFAPARPAR